MSQAKHTPGPWVWTPESESIHGYSPEGEALVVVYELNTNEADARLIAAAPELLEAAKMVLAWHDAETDPSGTTFWERVEMCRESEDALRTAVEKATGEAK